jgi:hypothetical protein
MNLVKGKNQIIILIIVFLTIKLSISKIYEDSQEDEIYKSYYQKTSKRKMTKKSNNYYNNDEYDFPEKPTSAFDFLYKSFLKRLSAYYDSYNDYFDGINYIFSNFKYLFRRYSGNKIINKTLTNINKPKYEHLFKEEEKIPKKRYHRHLDEKHNSQTNKIKLSGSYEYNNTDFYNSTTCPTSPNLKVYYYNYFCNGEKVSREEYEAKTSQGEDCEFYNNTQKLCFCPIHYSSCSFKDESRIKCMVKEIIVNNDINLTKYYDTFYEEYLKTPILENEKKIFNFSLKLKCGMLVKDEVTGSNANFYLSNSDDEKADFDIISTMNNNNTEYEKQYTKEEVMNERSKILDYFIKKKNLVMFKKPDLNLTFSIIDQLWIAPFRIKKYKIEDDLVEDLLSGTKSFNFTVDMNDIIENELGTGPFSTKNISYPYFEKGDMHFFEIEFEEKERQVRLFAYRGEIKK